MTQSESDDEDATFKKKQKEAFARAGLKEEVKIKLGKEPVKFEYDPCKIMKLQFKGQELILDEKLIVSFII